MKNEVIKQAFKLGNSAGVLLPIDWNGKKVSIKLIEKSIPQEIFDILVEKEILGNTIGIFLAGSYARGEETESSDIDVLVITDTINKEIKVGKYEIILVSKDRILEKIKKSLYIISLINESKAILNNYLLESLKSKIGKISFKKSIEDIKSMTRINEKMINLDEELKSKVFDGTIYSLVLRLREVYLMECIKNNKIHTNKEFIGIINKIASNESYNAYLRVKNDLKNNSVISVQEARNLINEIKKRIIKI